MKPTAADLLKFEPESPITEKGVRLNINVAIQYIGAWLVGQGAVPIFRQGALIGACGVGGGTAQEDEDCARAGVEKLCGPPASFAYQP